MILKKENFYDILKCVFIFTNKEKRKVWSMTNGCLKKDTEKL